MIQSEIEERARQKIFAQISILPEFLHCFFKKNESMTYATKLIYFGILLDYLNFVKSKYGLETILEITASLFENISLEDINMYSEHLSLKNTKNTVGTKLRSLKGIYKYLYYETIINKDIMSQKIVKNDYKKVHDDKTNQIKNLISNITQISNDALRKRNLSIVTLINDTGLSIQDIIELDLSNFVDNKIIYESNGNITQYILKEHTVKYLNDYLEFTYGKLIRYRKVPLYLSQLNDRITADAIRGIFKQYGNDIIPSYLQGKVYVRGNDKYKYILTIENRNADEF